MKLDLLTHFILTGVAIGLAAGGYKQNFEPVFVYPSIGLAASLGISCLIRLFVIVGG
jgi:hypothetical protein